MNAIWKIHYHKKMKILMLVVKDVQTWEIYSLLGTKTRRRFLFSNSTTQVHIENQAKSLSILHGNFFARNKHKHVFRRATASRDLISKFRGSLTVTLHFVLRTATAGQKKKKEKEKGERFSKSHQRVTRLEIDNSHSLQMSGTVFFLSAKIQLESRKINIWS